MVLILERRQWQHWEGAWEEDHQDNSMTMTATSPDT